MIKKCEICGEESKALHLHMKKHGVKKESKVDELEKNISDLTSIVSSLVDKIDKLTPKTQWAAKVEDKPSVVKEIDNKIDHTSVDAPVPPKWRMLVDEILGSDFGVNVIYPDSGSGFMFEIIVPKDKSNASPTHLDFYKFDVRTKALSGAEGIGGIKKFCEQIKVNLTRKQ